MARPDTPRPIDRRLQEVAQLLRERRTLVNPDPSFVDQVIARLPRRGDWMLAWAAWRVVPATLAVAAVLAIAVLVTGGSASQGVAAASIASTQQHSSDPLEWLLEIRPEAR